MTQSFFFRGLRLSPVLSFLFLGLFFLGGCAVHHPSSPGETEGGSIGVIDAPDETTEEPYQPIDDGKPLSSAELAAFNSMGELDRNLSMEEKQIVELHFKYFVHTRRQTVERFLKRSELYWPYVTEVFRSRGLPEELACLAFVESGFNPNAVSRAGATGMWQFMPFTGKKYGLTQNSWMDERRDPFKATHAAADYLSKLYEYFNQDWHLAIAAYNAGEGKIGRALAGTDSKTFFEICRKNELLDEKAQLRTETQQYLPRMLAFTKIIRNLERLGFERPDPSRSLNVTAVTVPAGVDLRRFAKDIKLNWEDFRGLNPAYLRGISSPGASSVAHIPAAKEKEALAWLGRKDAALYAGWRDYRVRKGDSLGSIAQRTGASTAVLRQVNGKKNNSLKIGEYLMVPSSVRAARSTMSKIAPESVPHIARSKNGAPLGGYKGKYKVASGDTLYALALEWGTTVDDICLLNDLGNKATLKIGQQLYIPSGKNIALAAIPQEQTPQAKPAVSLVSEARSNSSKGKYVAVQPGDTLSAIAIANNCTVEDICKANNITPKTRLAIGRELLIRPGASKAAAASVPRASAARSEKNKNLTTASVKKQGSVVVQAGDTLYSLARANGTSVNALAKANRINVRSPLKLGQVLLLP